MDRVKEEHAIRARDRNWGHDATDKESFEWVRGLYTDDATLLWPGMPPVEGMENIVTAWEGIKKTLEKPSLRYEAREIVIADSGELASDYGRVHLGYLQGGHEVKVVAKYLVVWRKDDAGTWRVQYDAWNYNEENA